MEETKNLTACPSCALPILADFYYCPNCGKGLRPKAISVSVVKQIGVYLLSFFLAPLGLYPAFKYLRQPDPKTKMIGWIAVILTFIGISITIYMFANFMQQVSSTLDSIGGGQYTGF